MRDAALPFAAEVERRISALSADEFYQRQGQGKVLLEEWYPISRLALHLKQPGLEVYVEAFGDSGIADGRIEEIGFRDRIVDVQVTYVDDYEAALRRELMQKQGFAPGAGSIARSKPSGAIIAEMAAVNHDHNLRQAAVGVAARFTKKAARPYPEVTILLIAFDDMTLLGFAMWKSLLALAQEHVNFDGSGFAAVYVINCATNELVKVA